MNGWSSTTRKKNRLKQQKARNKIQSKKDIRIGVDFGKNLSLGKIVVMSKLTILDVKTIAPEGNMSDRGLLCWLVVDTVYIDVTELIS